jgi:UDP-GlcNAc:undecaprenyl-phosphate GlcNAc-1-phosphate transferase
MLWLQVLLPALLAAIVTLVLTPGVVKLAVRVRAIDVPGGRKRHRREMPRLGGVAIFGGILFSLGPSVLVISGRAFRDVSTTEIAGFTVAVLIIFALGVVDDIRGLSPYTKFLVQVVAAGILVAIGWQFTALRLPWEGRFYLGAVGPILSILWIVGITNAINLIDGLDGLATGVVAIIASSLLVLAVLQRRPETVIVASCLLGACLGFLRHNWRPAKIYLGDSGSLTLGFILAAITLRSSVKASAALAVLVPMLALGLPLFDTLLVMWYRFLRGHRHLNRFARMFHADRNHLHHLLLETHTERSKTVLTLFGLAIGFCAMSLVVAASGSFWLGLAFLGVEFAAVLLIRRAGLNAEARRLTDDRLRHLDPVTGTIEVVPAARPAEVDAVEPVTK